MKEREMTLRLGVQRSFLLPLVSFTQAPNTASDDPSTTNSKSSVRKLNWKGGLGGGEVGWVCSSLMSLLPVCVSPV